MKKIIYQAKNTGKKIVFAILLLFATASQFVSIAQTAEMPLRRPISHQSPVWIVHIDTWVWPDPQKCIDLIPEDIRPYVIFNISLSVSDFVRKKYPFTIAESWLRTCAENRVWAMIQPASGGPNNFSDTTLETYEYFYKYPNFVGWNFCEQNWGYDTFQDYLARLQLFVKLLEFADQYGGYLFVSNFLSNPMGVYNGVGKLKSLQAYEEACKTYRDHYIICDKFTSETAFYENESTNLGPFLSGYAGQYGIRFDLCGFGKRAETGRAFPDASGAIPVIEHFMLTGATVTDGPELTWQIAILGNGTKAVADGYTAKDWKVHPQFTNINIDFFRKLLDGTIRIPSKEEVIEETKVVYVCDENNTAGNYAAYPSLYTGLYAMDGEKSNNTTWFKKTGRYPSIPVVHKEGEYETGEFETIIRSSEYTKLWTSQAVRVDSMNKLFPKEYTGDIYARRMKNSWLTYHTDMDASTAQSGTIPLKYNTCDSIYVSHQWYSLGVINEYSDKLKIYLNNYCSAATYGMRTDVIKIFGCTTQPTWSHTYRGDRNECSVIPSWDSAKKTLTLTVWHNGPLDITVNCSGKAVRTLPEPPVASIVQPAAAPIYMGARQYEAENFEYKNINSATETNLMNYSAMGYVNFGTKSSASIRKTINVLKNGSYTLETRYSTPSTSGNVTSISLYVNGNKVATPTFVNTKNSNSWAVNTQKITLNAGDNTIEFRANSTGKSIYFDNIVVSESNASMYHFENDIASTTANTIELVDVQSGSAGVVSYTNSKGQTSKCFKSYTVGSVNGTGVANLAMFPASSVDNAIVWKEYYETAGAKKGVLLRGNNSSAYANGLKQGYLFISENNADGTVKLKSYVAAADGLNEKSTYNSEFTVSKGAPCWFRASTIENKIIFECSVDSVNWIGESATTFNDDTYISGSTQLVWGLNSNNFDWTMDNITYLSGNIVVSRYVMDEFRYQYDSGTSDVQTFIVSGNSLVDDIAIACSDNFEVSLSENSGYAQTLTVTRQDAGNIPFTTIYVRMKQGLDVGRYDGEITVKTARIKERTIRFSGEVFGRSIRKKYNFTDDKPGRGASTPPALNMLIAKGNSATAGVRSYTDANGVTSNALKPYSGGQRNATGVIDLNLFSRIATNYSVTWKQCIATTDDYKVGVLLRGDTLNIGNASTGYVQGLMQGYLFIAYTVGNQKRSEFRIYKSTSDFNQLNMLVNVEASSLAPLANQPVWYRASVSGWAMVSLSIEYSLDGGATWKTGATAVDSSPSVFTNGATQFVWGLGANKLDFYVDDIVFYGISNIENDVDMPDNIRDIHADGLTVVSKEYYTLMGYKTADPWKNNLKGFFIVKNIMSDGSVKSIKIYVQ